MTTPTREAKRRQQKASTHTPQKQQAEALVGRYVRFRYLPRDIKPTPIRVVEAVNGMVRLAFHSGFYAPHLFAEVRAPKEAA
jgi:hypothetical protein